MLEFLYVFIATALSTALDVVPIVAILVLFQVAVLRRRPPHLGRIVIGAVFVLLGLTLFLIGLEEALFPIGETMARQLTAAGTVGTGSLADGVDWTDYMMVYAFAAAIGFATMVAEPSLIAVALKAEEVLGGAVRAWGLRIAVAVGQSHGGYSQLTLWFKWIGWSGSRPPRAVAPKGFGEPGRGSPFWERSGNRALGGARAARTQLSFNSFLQGLLNPFVQTYTVFQGRHSNLAVKLRPNPQIEFARKGFRWFNALLLVESQVGVYGNFGIHAAIPQRRRLRKSQWMSPS